LSAQSHIGSAVATVLKLQIQKGLVKEDKTRPREILGRGAVYFVPVPLRDLSRYEAERLARVNGAQLTLWGRAFPYADGAIAQTYLSIPERYRDFRDTENELWTVNAAGLRLQLNVPRSYVEFSPIGIKRSLIDQYGSEKYLRFCPDKAGSDCISAA